MRSDPEFVLINAGGGCKHKIGTVASRLFTCLRQPNFAPPGRHYLITEDAAKRKLSKILLDLKRVTLTREDLERVIRARKEIRA